MFKMIFDLECGGSPPLSKPGQALANQCGSKLPHTWNPPPNDTMVLVPVNVG